MEKIFIKIQYLIILGILYLPIGFVMGEKSGDPITLDNPITGINSIEDLIAEILKIVVTIATPIAILAMIYSGFLFVKARGKPEELESAKTTLKYTIIGIVVLLGASLLATVIKGTIQGLGAGV